MLEAKHINLYQTESAFTKDYNGSYYSVPWLSYTKEGKEVRYNRGKLRVEHLINAGYAEIKTDYAASSLWHTPGSESDYQVIQIHSNCPILLETIEDFDDYLTSATTFVWREELPIGWTASELMAKYEGVELARPPMEELFGGVVADDVENLSLSFAGGESYVCDASIVTERYNMDHYSQFKSPKNVEITIRGVYTSVAQCSFSELTTTTALTLNLGGLFSCHDTTGLFEYNYALKNLTINGPFRWDGMVSCNNLFINNYELLSIPYVSSWGRTSIYNTMYPHNNGTRGSADFGGAFVNLNKCTSIGPVINMNAASLSGCTIDGVSQLGLSGPTFKCPVLEDVRIINLNNNDWNFADINGYTYIPNMDVDSIEYLLNNVADCTSNPHTVTFSNLHENDISQSAIDAAAAKGWTVAYQAL